MTSSNGKHRLASLSVSDSPIDTPQANQGESWSERFETTLTESHEQIVAKSAEFIRSRPGTSLLIAVAVGGLVGWLIKRRG